jgi:hypothetical protein
MTAETPTNEPKELRAGVTWEWDRNDLSDYPATTWTLKYWFKRQGGTDKFSITASASGSNFAVSVAAATTLAYVADDYTWVAVVTAGSEVFEVDHGTMKILPRYDQDVALDDRTHAKKVLEAIEAVLESRATKDQEEYTIGTRSLKRTPLKDLIALRDKYKAEVFGEQLAENARNGKEGNKLVVRL